MELLQGAAPTADVSIAGEHFAMSTHETALVVTAAATDVRQVDAVGVRRRDRPDTVTVTDFLQRSGLTYAELLELAFVEWVSPPGDAQPPRRPAPGRHRQR